MWTGAPLPDGMTGPVGLGEVDGVADGVGAITEALAVALVGAELVSDGAAAVVAVRAVQPASKAPIVANITSPARPDK